MQAPTVFIVDDNLSVLNSLRAMVAAMGLESASFISPEKFLRVYESQMTGCVVLDLKMPGMSGFEVQERLRGEGKRIPIIMFTAHGDIPASVKAVQRGAFHFLEKPCPPERLAEVILAAIEADSRRRCEDIRVDHVRAKLHRLSREEQGVLAGLVLGKTNSEIANELDISSRTVQFRHVSLMEKLEVASKTELMTLIFSVSWQPPAEDSSALPDFSE